MPTSGPKVAAYLLRSSHLSTRVPSMKPFFASETLIKSTSTHGTTRALEVEFLPTSLNEKQRLKYHSNFFLLILHSGIFEGGP